MPSVCHLWSRAAAALRDGGRTPAKPWVVALICVTLAGLASIALRQDSNWDLQNYHLYNAWAFVHGRMGVDWAPAQLQSYYSPLLDLPFYTLLAHDVPPRLIAFALAIPTGIAWYCLARIVVRLLDDVDAQIRKTAIVTAIALAVTAPMPISLIGLTMNDWYTAAFVLAAVWRVVRALDGDTSKPLAHIERALLAAGVLAGIGAGLKLTGAIYCVGLAAGALVMGRTWRGRIRAALLTSGAIVIAFALTAGPWMLLLYRKFGNPLFPYFNNIFRSPWTDPVALTPGGFGPASWSEWLVFPFMLLWKLQGYVAEPEFRDARPALLYGLALVALVIALAKRLPSSAPATRSHAPMHPHAEATALAWRFVIVFCATSFVAWAALYRIYRYLVPLEMLAGVLTVALLVRILPRHRARMAMAAALIFVVLTAKFPTWWRVKFGEHFLTVQMPPVRADSLVLLMSDEPMSYVLPSFPADARFAGLTNNFNDPGRDNLLQRSIAATIRDHHGALYALAVPVGQDVGREALATMGLARTTCAQIVTNLRVSPLELCELQRR